MQVLVYSNDGILEGNFLVHALNPNWATALQRDLTCLIKCICFGKLGERVVLTGSGNYVLRRGISDFHVKMIGPGQDGNNGFVARMALVDQWSGNRI